MLICDQWFHAVFIRQSSGRKKLICIYLLNIYDNHQSEKTNKYLFLYYIYIISYIIF